jgi:two-component system, NarL family, response regulator LiaR
MTRVLIVDDYDVVRRGLGVFLKIFDDLELVGEARNGAEAIRMAAKTQPDVILMDIVMPVMDGITATRMIRNLHPNIQIIALTSTVNREILTEAALAGAYTCLFKNTSIHELVMRIRAARQC